MTFNVFIFIFIISKTISRLIYNRRKIKTPLHLNLYKQRDVKK